MDIGVPSRFACLKIEDDEFKPVISKHKDLNNKKKVDKRAAAPPKKPEKEVKVDNKPSARKLNNNINQSVLGKTHKKKQTAQQWEEWKEKDNEIVNGNFEEDLQNAILLSTLDYEHNKDTYKQVQDAEEKERAQALIKKKKTKVMSLEQFLNPGANRNNMNKNCHEVDIIVKVDDTNSEEHFFEKVQLDAKQEYKKEQLKEKRKKHEANIDEVISLAQCQQKLDQEKNKVYSLQLELQKIKSESAAVKERNKHLCDILGQGEMKDKADVLIELKRLYAEKNELSEEVSRLHVLLEQERSKVATLTSDSHNNKHKDKKRKQKGN